MLALAVVGVRFYRNYQVGQNIEGETRTASADIMQETEITQIPAASVQQVTPTSWAELTESPKITPTAEPTLIPTVTISAEEAQIYKEESDTRKAQRRIQQKKQNEEESTGQFLGLPIILWITIILLVVAGLFLGYTSAGRRIYAIGTSRESAAVAGIKEPKVTFYSFVICGAVTGLAGMLYTANYAIGYYGMADGFEMTAIAICVLGGVSITGGKGRMDGVAIGALIMSVITYFISMIPGMSVWQKSLQGGIIIVAVAINYFTEQSAKRQALKERSALI